jgi:FPC/CPF motif-containing protein YcgG
MRVKRVRALMARLSGAAEQEMVDLIIELSHEINDLLSNLDTSITDLQSVLGATPLGPNASTVDVLVQGLVEEFTTPSTRDHGLYSREGDPILQWSEVVEGVVHGTDEVGLPDWAGPAFRQVTSVLTKDDFPCIFARQANHLKSGWVCFVDSADLDSDRERVKQAIVAYLHVLERNPRTRTIIMPLLVIVKPAYPMLSLKQYRAQAWDLFQYLHENDPAPWPLDVPIDPDRGDWSFCFGGIQLFSNVSSPAHKIHTSRNLGDSLVFAMQPRTNFDLVGGNNRKGRAVRTEIRQRAERYEGRAIASHLGYYGTPENREWMQMATKDGDNDPDFPKVCPFKFHAKKDRPR